MVTLLSSAHGSVPILALCISVGEQGSSGTFHVQLYWPIL